MYAKILNWQLKTLFKMPTGYFYYAYFCYDDGRQALLFIKTKQKEASAIFVVLENTLIS